MDKNMDLDALFAEAALTEVKPSAELMQHILADAERLQPKAQPLVRPVISAKPRGGAFGWFTEFADVLGGARAVAGLSLAGLTGLYLGVAQPGAVAALTSLVSGTTTTVEQMDLLPATSTLFTEN